MAVLDLSTKIYLLLSIACTAQTIFSMYLNEKTHSDIFKSDILQITAQAAALDITLKNFNAKKDAFKNLFEIFFQKLKNISNSISNKQDLWYFFDYDYMVRIFTPAIYNYYQRDKNFTDSFINNINSLFDCTENEQINKDAKICAFLKIKSKFRTPEVYSVFWNRVSKKAFLYIPYFSPEITPSWYNILAQDDSELSMQGFTKDNKKEMENQYWGHVVRNNTDTVLFLTRSYITFICDTQYKDIQYVHEHENQNLTIQRLQNNQLHHQIKNTQKERQEKTHFSSITNLRSIYSFISQNTCILQIITYSIAIALLLYFLDKKYGIEIAYSYEK